MAAVIAVATAIALSSLGADAEPSSPSALPTGKKAVVLHGANGATLRIGTITFTPDGDGAAYDVALDAPEFQDEFLSMRPFRCLAGETESWCYLDYPYTLKKRITADDLVDLEYSLLFLFKPPAGYGIDAWNGLYFKLKADGQGGLSGDVHDVDLNPLGVPSDDKSARVISHRDLTAVSSGSRRFERIEIR
ncbi:MAG: hypothetical protein ACRCS9_13170 [Hyphomicrobium sp.]